MIDNRLKCSNLDSDIKVSANLHRVVAQSVYPASQLTYRAYIYNTWSSTSVEDCLNRMSTSVPSNDRPSRMLAGLLAASEGCVKNISDIERPLLKFSPSRFDSFVHIMCLNPKTRLSPHKRFLALVQILFSALNPRSATALSEENELRILMKTSPGLFLRLFEG